MFKVGFALADLDILLIPVGKIEKMNEDLRPLALRIQKGFSVRTCNPRFSITGNTSESTMAASGEYNLS